MLNGVSPSFRFRADSAAYWEAWVAAVLARAGLYTLHHPFLIDNLDHSQSVDLDVFRNYPGIVEDCGQTPLEIKSLSLEFNNSSDYPYEDVLVCSQSSFLKKWPGKEGIGRDFMLVSTVTGAMVWVPTGTRVGFKEVMDKSRNECKPTAYCQKAELRELGDFISKVKYGY